MPSEIIRKIFLPGLLLLLLFLNGGLYISAVCVMIAVSSVSLAWGIWEGKKLKIHTGREGLVKMLLLLCAVVSAFTGIDSGERVYGLIRLAAVFLTMLMLEQKNEEQKVFCLKWIPIYGIGMVLISFLFYPSAVSWEWISGVGRLAGAFAYPNTMALFCLLGIAAAEHLYVTGKRLIQAGLCAGLLWTGSRAAFVFLCAWVLWRVAANRRRKCLLWCLCGLCGSMAVICSLGERLPDSLRFLKLTLYASTFQGRLLYWEDAIRILIKYPAGVGYMGYFYVQQAMQTGAYSVRFVHNELLQCMLDYGILAGAAAVLLFLQEICSQEKACWKKELLLLTGAYSLFDFHLQYFSIVFILLLLEEKPEKEIKGSWVKPLSFLTGIAAGLYVLSVGIGNFFAERGNYAQAVFWNPLSIDYKMEYLLQAEELKTAMPRAERVISQNAYSYAAYKIISNQCAQEGNLEAFIHNRREVLKLRKYHIEEYEEYFEILLSFYLRASGEKDPEQIERCTEEMIRIPEMILEVKQNTSIRAFRIVDKPELIWKPEYQAFIDQLKGEYQ